MKIETDLMETVCRATDAMKYWLTHRAHFIPLLKDKRMLNVYSSWVSDKLYIQASGDSDQLTTLFKALAFHGFHLLKDSKRPAANQPDWAGKFRKNWTDSGGVDWFFEIYVSFCSTVCQRIQVGTEIKEVPVYKIVCGDLAYDETVAMPDDIP